jgi:predicted lipoprotein with Yx(FWY)xxD motif
VVPSGLNPADFSTLASNEGTIQASYKGWPLYYFALSTAPGQLIGENLTGFGGTWYVVAPDVAQASMPSSSGIGGY